MEEMNGAMTASPNIMSNLVNQPQKKEKSENPRTTSGGESLSPDDNTQLMISSPAQKNRI